MTEHREIPIKVNAWVDEGIADLVTALSEVDGLVTVESCEGRAEKPLSAYVIFRFGNWRKSGEFLFDKLLGVLPPDLRASVSMRLEAYDTDTALGSIAIEPSAVPAVVTYVRKLSAPI